MQNRYFVEVDDKHEWGSIWLGMDYAKVFLDFDEAVEYAKTLTIDHSSVRVVDECYGRTWWEYKKEEV